MAITLKIELPDGPIVIDRLKSVILQAPDGEMGILPGHLPLVGLVDVGILTAVAADSRERFVTGSGMLWVADDRVTVLLLDLVAEKDIDAAAAKQLLADATAALATHEFAGREEACKELTADARFAEAQLALLELGRDG
ncbi:MAG: FoF1 ATP synthase subunit delta/epsilon [Verrucomicrobiales bacterium]